MTHDIEISVSDILDGAIRQSGEDFRGLRSVSATDAEVDAKFRDYVISHGDDDGMTEEMRRAMQTIYERYRAYCESFGLEDGKVKFSLVSKDENAGSGLALYVKWAIIYRILAWWYAGRSADRSALYDTKFEEQMGGINTLVVPKFSTRRLRYY